MMGTPLVTFNDKHLFNVRINIESCTSPISPVREPAGYKVAGKRNHHSGVVFQPSYHKRSQQEKKFIFTDRSDGILGESRGSCQAHKCNNSKAAIHGTHHDSTRPSHMEKSRLPIIVPLFRARFKPLGTHERDRVDKAIYSYITLSSHPYTNIRPYDHRGLSGGNTQLNTRITPDPFDIRFRQLSLTEQLHDDNGDGMDTRLQHNLKTTPDEQPRKAKHGGKMATFITTRTPEPPFQGHLYFNKGRYSPAFKAHNAFLDRIAENIKH